MDEGPDLGGISCLKVLKDRKNWLAARIKAKQSVGYETTYDQREHDALDWIIADRQDLIQALSGGGLLGAGEGFPQLIND